MRWLKSIFWSCFAAWALTSWPAFAQAPATPAVAMYNLAWKAYQEGSVESAIIFFKRATELDPNLFEAQYNLGIIYQNQKRYREALSRLSQALRIKPDDQDTHYQLGVVWQETGQPEKAREHFLKIAPSHPHFAEAQQRLSTIGAAGAPGQESLETAYGSPAGQSRSYPAATVTSPAGKLQSQTPAYQPYQAMGSPEVTQAAGQASMPSHSVTSPPVSRLPDLGASKAAGGQPPAAFSPPGPYAAGLAPAPTPVPILANTTLRVVGTGFAAPTGLAFDRLGNLYVANFRTNTIERISPDGTRSKFCTGANLKGPVGLVVDDNGYLYVANYLGGNVARVSPAGVATIVATGFHQPYYLALDSDGNLFVSQQEDNSIVRISLPRPIGVKPQ